MGEAHDLSPVALGTPTATRARGTWAFSWPLVMAGVTYLYLLLHSRTLLRDGDTYWHVAAGRWILEHGTVPARDPFSHSMPGAPWTAHEWLSEVVLATAHAVGGWTIVVAVTALAFALCIGLLTRALLRWLEPVYAVFFAAMALCMTAGHALARPHMLAMPLMMMWMIGLVRASDERRAPSLWLLPVMLLWANMHGGFTFGIAMTFAFAAESLLAARKEGRLAPAMREWGIFIVLAMACALATPYGTGGIFFTWHLMVDSPYAMQRIEEWKSPNFHIFQPMLLWLLGGLAVMLHQGLRLPPVRLALMLGMLYLALKHMRHIEILGLVGPLVLAAPLAAQWRERKKAGAQLEHADRLFELLARPAGRSALVGTLLVMLAIPAWLMRASPIAAHDALAPVRALRAVQEAGIRGPVLNNFSLGGYLIYSGIPVFIDGRADMYGDRFLLEYTDALGLRTKDSLPDLLSKYGITWTLLEREGPTVSMLDQMPGWRRVHTDEYTVVHARIDALPATPHR